MYSDMYGKEEIKSALLSGGPKGKELYPNGGTGDFWRMAATSPAYADIVSQIREEAERCLGEPAPELTYAKFMLYVEQGTRREYELVYFERRRRLNSFAFMALLEPERSEWADALIETVWAICDEFTWCLPAHVSPTVEAAKRTIDLFSAETGFALREIEALLGDRLPRLIRERIAEETEKRLFRPYLELGPHHWETMTHNWSAVCAGSVGAAALIAMDDEDRLADIVAKALGSMDCFLSGYGEDGACLEGLGYWNYGFGYYVFFADLLRRRTNGGIDLLAGEKIRRIAAFQQKCYLDESLAANFSDSRSRSPVHIGLSHYLGGLYDEVDVPPARIASRYAEDHCSRLAHALRNVIWFDPEQEGAEWTDASSYLPDAQWIVSRRVSPEGRFGFAAKGGHNDEPHNHNDVGQFILTADGESFLVDLGSGEYTKDYFGDGRYAYDCNGSQGHSVPIVDDRLQEAGAESAAVVLDAAAGADEDRLRIEMGAVYRLPKLKSLIRGFAWRKPAGGEGLPSLALTDEYRFAAAPESLTERLVAFLPPETEEPGLIRLKGRGGRTLRIEYDASLLEPNVEERVYSGHLGVKKKWYAIDLNARAERLEPEMTVGLKLQFE